MRLNLVIYQVSLYTTITCRLVLFRLKPGVAPAELEAWARLGKGMVGKIPGQYLPGRM